MSSRSADLAAQIDGQVRRPILHRGTARGKLPLGKMASTTEFIDSSGEISPGPMLKRSLALHSTVLTSTGLVIVTGGIYSDLCKKLQCRWYYALTYHESDDTHNVTGFRTSNHTLIYRLHGNGSLMYHNNGPETNLGLVGHACAAIKSDFHGGREVLIVGSTFNPLTYSGVSTEDKPEIHFEIWDYTVQGSSWIDLGMNLELKVTQN